VLRVKTTLYFKKTNKTKDSHPKKTGARSQQVSLEATPYYHCVSRCARRAFLCGESFKHRCGWVEDKLLALAEVFCIDVAAYAVMLNHYHVVLHINTQQAEPFS